jgi:alpha-2-macroglobulin
VRGFELLKEISAALSNSNSWMSTQTISWCLKSAGNFASAEQKGEMKFSYTWEGKEVSAASGLPVAQVKLPVAGVKQGTLSLKNTSSGSLFVQVITEGVPARGTEDDAAENLKIDVLYADTKGVPLDPASVEQGTSFVATVMITNPGIRGSYKNLALKEIFPSGWEINNLRLDDAQARLTGDIPTYQDIRDDRVYTYFDLPANQTRTYRVLLTASYAGTYYLPAVSVEAMYDHTVYARKKGNVVVVTKPSPAN